MSSRKVSLAGGTTTATTIAAAAALDKAENAAPDKKDSTSASVKASDTDAAKTNAAGTESTATSTDTPPKEAKSFLETAKSCVAQTIRTMVAKSTTSDSVTSKESKEDVREDRKSEAEEKKANEDSKKASAEEKVSPEEVSAAEAALVEGDSGKDATKSKEKSPPEADNNKKSGEATAKASTKAGEEAASGEEETQLKEPPSRNSAKEVKRVTRNSPLLVTSAANKKEALGGGDSAEGAGQAESDEASATCVVAKRAGQIRGRKSIKDAAAAKDAAAGGDPVEIKEELTKTDSKKTDTEKRDSEERVSCEKDKVEESEYVDCRAEPEAAAETAVAIKEEPVEQPATTRQTRKSVAKEPIPNTRVTRNRQSSTGSTSQPAPPAPAKPEATPPQAAGNEGRRGRKPGWGKKGAAAATPPADIANSKRKRSSLDDAPAAPVGEPGPKYAKVEVAKDDSEGGEEEAMSTTTTTSDSTAAPEEIKIKQELMESDESSDVSSAANPAATPPAAAASAARGRGRWNSRRAGNRLTFSPSTRSTRQSKAVTSPSPTPPPTTSGPPPNDSKRRRTGTPNATTRSSSSLSLRRTAAASAQAPDEDSKDSLASSMDDILMGEGKAEKLSQPESEEALDFEMAEKAPLAEKSEEEDPEPAAKVKKANGLVEELTVDTGDEVATAGGVGGGEETEPPTTPVASTSATSVLNGDSGSEKAASLSPELVSEGVSEISVKQFYKTPKFRENNLGIEEDPKLGELVQKVATPSAADAEGEGEKGLKDDDCLSNASIQEGELRFDESSDEKKSGAEAALSPLTVPDADGGEDEAEAVTPLLDESDSAPMEAGPQQEEEDDPESGSMDNNASVDEDDGGEPVEGIDELDEESAAAIVEVVRGRNRRRSSVKLEEKTKLAECDMDEVKLKPDPAVEEEEPAKKEEDAEEENVEEEPSPKGEAGNSDDVLAKISAELLKIGEKLKEKPVKVELGEGVKGSEASETEGKLGSDEDEKKPAEDEEDSKENANEEEEEPSKPPLEAKEDADADDNKLSGDDEKDTSKLSTSSVHSSSSNLNLSADKPAGDDDVASVKSNQSNASWVTLDLEHDEEVLRQKEQHLQNLGLLTHKAAEMRRQEFIQIAATTQQQQLQQQLQQPSHQPAKRAKVGSAPSAQEYTGTLKTVIKLNRNANGSASAAAATTSSAGHTRQKSQLQRDSGANRRQSLKMTFQKGRARGQGNGHDRHAGGDHNAPAEDSYYTIQNENEDSSHSDLHEATAVLPASKKDEKEEILIPEKASSFKFHPGRLCEDQCFYCSGKFGLYDTPCHVGQIKSVERQQKILANEEKLTVDNCLCDACFRHVDRRANAPSYKKRLSAPGSLENASGGFGADPSAAAKEDGAGGSGDPEDVQSRRCVVPECPDPAAHSLRRKCIRKSVKKFFLNLDIPTLAPSVWLCKSHYDAVMQCSGCVLCKRRLGKNHMYHITSDTGGLEKALNDMGIPVHLGIGTAVCKLCRYFANLLMKPSESARNQKAEFVKNYRKKLLQFHNIHDVSNEASEGEPEGADGADPSSAASRKAKGGAAKKPNSSASPAGKHDSSSPLRSSKEMPSPAGSSGSSVECLGLSSSNAGASQRAPENDTDFEGPLMSSDSNSSSPPLAASSDVPMSKLKAILQSTGSCKAAAGGESSADISNVLRANPNISMRELFPGEEDLGMNFYAPFGSNTSQRTPEGWTRVKTFLQYDEPTRRLWEELQKPYGNQSSFLRHLILLEKYYRNGDLILSPHASSNASVYTQTVRQRLVSFDQGHCGGLLPPAGTPKKASKEEGAAPKETRPPTIEIHEDDDEEMAEAGASRPLDGEAGAAAEAARNEGRPRSASVDKLAKQLNTSAVTITARPKEPAKATRDAAAVPQQPHTQQPAGDKEAGLNGGSLGGGNSRSILKANLLGMNKSVEILPVSGSASSSSGGKSGASVPGSIASSGAESKQQKILEVANKLLGFQMETAKFPSAALLTSPPELVSFQRRSTGNMPPSSPSSSASTSSAAASALQSATKRSAAPPAAAAAPSKPAPGSRPGAGPASSAGGSRPPPNVVILPDTLTAQERQQSKSWRPTLMPVAENQHLLAKGGPLYQTVDKRRLPAVVQVQSGGKPFLISIFDYNRMCILRREKILRDQMLKASKGRQGEGGGKSQGQGQGGQQGQKHHQQQHEHQQQQHQPPAPKAASSAMPMGMAGGGANYQKSMLTAKQQQQQVAQRQHFQLQMMQLQKQQMQQHAAMKAGAGGGGAPNAGGPHSSGSGGPLRYQPIAPKGSPGQQQQQQANAGPPVSGANSFATPPMIPMLANAINNSSWMWNNFPDANQMMLNGVAAAAAAAAQSQAPKMPQLLHKSGGGGGAGGSSAAAKQLQHQHQQQLMLDNNLMSKIPKSLTVIPQHKLMGKQANGQGQGSGSGGGSGGGHKE